MRRLQRPKIQPLPILPNRGNRRIIAIAGILQIGNHLAVQIQPQHKPALVHRRRNQLQRPYNHLAQKWMPRRGVQQRIARRIQRYPKPVTAIEREVVRQPRQIVDKQVVSAGFRPGQPIAADAISPGFIDQHIGVVRAEGHAVGELQFVQQHAGLAGLKVIAQQTPVAAVLDDRLAVMAVTPTAARIAEVGEMPGRIDRHIIGETEGQAIGGGGQRDQLPLRIQRQQAFDPVGNDQHAVRMPGQSQRTPAGIGQHLALRAIETGADQSAVMQAGDQEILFQQQRLRAFDVARPDLRCALEFLVLGVGAFF